MTDSIERDLKEKLIEVLRASLPKERAEIIIAAVKNPKTQLNKDQLADFILSVYLGGKLDLDNPLLKAFIKKELLAKSKKDVAEKTSKPKPSHK